MEKEVPDLASLRSIAKEIVENIEPTHHATLITLSGELGAGKTTLSQMIGKELGVEETMVSPTFVLEKIYNLDGTHGFRKLIHIDAYRLTKGEELMALGFEELLKDASHLILLERPEMVGEALPKADKAITLRVTEDGKRIYSEAYE